MTLVQALQATAELSSTRLSQEAAQMLYDDLKAYDEQAVINALARCRRELKGKLTVAEIISRIDDGRPGPDEAWAMLPWDEESTAVLSAEMQEAQNHVRVIYDHDKVGARLAFKERYTRMVNDARNYGDNPVKWQISIGYNRKGREAPLLNAVEAGYITAQEAGRYIEMPEPILMIAGTPPVQMPEDVRKQIEALAKK